MAGGGPGLAPYSSDSPTAQRPQRVRLRLPPQSGGKSQRSCPPPLALIPAEPGGRGPTAPVPAHPADPIAPVCRLPAPPHAPVPAEAGRPPGHLAQLKQRVPTHLSRPNRRLHLRARRGNGQRLRPRPGHAPGFIGPGPDHAPGPRDTPLARLCPPRLVLSPSLGSVPSLAFGRRCSPNRQSESGTRGLGAGARPRRGSRGLRRGCAAGNCARAGV